MSNIRKEDVHPCDLEIHPAIHSAPAQAGHNSPRLLPISLRAKIQLSEAKERRFDRLDLAPERSRQDQATLDTLLDFRCRTHGKALQVRLRQLCRQHTASSRHQRVHFRRHYLFQNPCTVGHLAGLFRQTSSLSMSLVPFRRSLTFHKFSHSNSYSSLHPSSPTAGNTSLQFEA
jgi:hypothetical protein